MTSIVAPGDFNADGRPDLIARDSSGELWLYPNNGAGDWLKRVDLGGGWNIMSSIVAPGDFDADGNVDLVARDTAAGCGSTRATGRTSGSPGRAWGRAGTP